MYIVAILSFNAQASAQMIFQNTLPKDF